MNAKVYYDWEEFVEYDNSWSALFYLLINSDTNEVIVETRLAKPEFGTEDQRLITEALKKKYKIEYLTVITL